MSRSPLRHHACALIAAFAVCILALPAWADGVVVAVQGRLMSAAGGPVADGDYALAFRLYDTAKGGSALWTEYHLSVAVKGGAMDLQIGAKEAKNPLGVKLFTGNKARWIGLTVGGDPELPRVRLASVPQAIVAIEAGTALGLQCSGCIQSSHLAAAAVKAEHMAFTWAGSVTKGGPANSAKVADIAKVADNAKKAEVATLAEKAVYAASAGSAGSADKAAVADTAKSANKAAIAVAATTAETAKSADLAKNLKCTGCVSTVHVVPGSLDGSRLATDLTLTGKVKINGTLEIGGAKTDPLLQAKGKGATVVLTHDRQLQRVRLHTAANAPYKCDASEMGALYFDSGKKAMMVCDGSKWRSASSSAPAFCTVANTDITKKSYTHFGSGNCGPYYANQTWMSANDAYKGGQFGWHDSCGKTGPNPFCAIKYPDQVVINSFRVLLHTNPPKKCRFQGSNDSTNGLNGSWVQLYGPVDCPSGKEGQWGQTRSFANNTAYSWYRLHCPGSPSFALYEWEMFCVP